MRPGLGRGAEEAAAGPDGGGAGAAEGTVGSGIAFNLELDEGFGADGEFEAAVAAINQGTCSADVATLILLYTEAKAAQREGREPSYAASSGSCSSTQFARRQTWPSSRCASTNGAPQSGHDGMLLKGSAFHSVGTYTKRRSFPSGSSLQEPKHTRKLSWRGRGTEWMIVNRSRLFCRCASWSLAAAPRAEPGASNPHGRC